MKQSLEYHVLCLRNMELYQKSLDAQAEWARGNADKARSRAAIYREQIERAKREGRDGFDRDKFNLKRGAANGS